MLSTRRACNVTWVDARCRLCDRGDSTLEVPCFGQKVRLTVHLQPALWPVEGTQVTGRLRGSRKCSCSPSADSTERWVIQVCTGQQQAACQRQPPLALLLAVTLRKGAPWQTTSSAEPSTHLDKC